MGKLSKILLNSLVFYSASAKSFSVTSCSNDVSTLPEKNLRFGDRSIQFSKFEEANRFWSMSPCFLGLFLVLNWIKGALSLEIDDTYFINNIDDDGSYGWDAGDEKYTKTITADNLDFSIDAEGK